MLRCLAVRVGERGEKPNIQGVALTVHIESGYRTTRRRPMMKKARYQSLG